MPLMAHSVEPELTRWCVAVAQVNEHSWLEQRTGTMLVGARIRTHLKSVVLPRALSAIPPLPSPSESHLVYIWSILLMTWNRVKPHHSPQVSPPENATPGPSRGGLRSSIHLPRASHDLGYIFRSPSTGASRKRTTSLVEEGDSEEEEDDLRTPSKVVSDFCRDIENVRDASKEADRSRRASSELTALGDLDNNSDDDGKEDGKITEDEDEDEGIRDDASDSSDCVVVAVRPTTPKDRIEVGTVVMARWPDEGVSGHGVWFALVSPASLRSTQTDDVFKVLDPEGRKGAWWESSIVGEPHPDAYLVKCIPTGAEW